MIGILLLGALLALAVEVHPGETLRRTARAGRDGGCLAGLRARAGPLLATTGLVAAVVALALVLPASLRDDRGVRIATLGLAAAALGCAGWHRIATSSRLDLRRAGLLEADGGGEGGEGLLRGALREIRRPAWHLFWWAAAPGLVLAALPVSRAAPALAWVVYLGVAAGWSALVARRSSLGREKLIETGPFRILHSLGGLALVFTAGLLLVDGLARAGAASFVTEGVLRPLLGPAG